MPVSVTLDPRVVAEMLERELNKLKRQLGQ